MSDPRTVAYDGSLSKQERERERKRCLVCYTELRGTTVVVITPCDHNDICGLCHLRLRFLHNDKKCPMCKTENDQIVADYCNKAKDSFEDYPVWGNTLGDDFVHNDGMFFPTGYYERVVTPLFGYNCTVKTCAARDELAEQFVTLRSLQDHLRTEHRLTLCHLCVDHKRDFVSRLPRFSPSGLQKHSSTGNGSHPVCEFCRPRRFYDITALHDHLAKEHYKCHVCENQGMANQYFKNYRSLERHFDTQHFLCNDVQCMEARFVVFANEIDLRLHERQVHGGSSNTKLQLEFRVAGRSSAPSLQQEAPSEADFNYNLDGQAFVPQALPTNSNRDDSNELHPQHVQRTLELREQAAQLRGDESEEGNDVAFPVLQQQNQQQDQRERISLGWASEQTIQRLGRPRKPAGEVTDQDFPTLAPAPKPQAVKKLSSLKKKKTAPNVGGWNNSETAVRTVTAAAPRVVSPFVPPGPPNNNNGAANLASGNFPSLPGSAGGPTPYTAAQNFAKRKTGMAAPDLSSANNFPSLPGASRAPVARVATNLAKKKSSQEHLAASNFPSLGDGGGKQYPAAQALAQKLASSVSVDDVKASLGTSQYKKLKGYTKQFAARELDPDAYVDHAAAIFADGYADSEFWSFVPALVASCPNAPDNDAAIRYMDNLKRMRNGALNAEANNSLRSAPKARSAQPATNNWKNPTVTAAPQATKAPTTSSRYIPAPQPMAYPRVTAKKKNAWSGSGPNIARLAKARPGSIAVAAAAVADAPSRASATKFMAKESKQENWQQAGGKTSNKKKNTKKNELRALAFGK